MFCIYDKKTTKGNFLSNGLGVLNECIKFEVTEEKNGDYSLELEYPSSSKKALYFEKYNIIKDDLGQLFRIYQVQKDSKNDVITTVWAKHIFYDLAFDFLENVSVNKLAVKSAMTMAMTPTMAAIFTVDSDIVIASSLSFKQINGTQAMFSILQKWGMGELLRDNFNIKILTAIGKDNGVTVKYGKNINEIKIINDSTDVVTKLYPIGNGGITLTEKYISVVNWNSSQYPPFPIIKKVQFDADDEPTLRILAQNAATSIGLERTTIEVDMVELSRTKEYENYKQLEIVKVCDIVSLKHKELNVDGKVQVIKVKSDRLTGVNSKVYLGQLRKVSEDINKLLKTTTDEFGNMVAQAMSSMMYYSNAVALNVATTSIQPIYLGVTAVASTNLTVLLAIYGVASLACTLTIQIQLDNKDIVFTPKQKLQQGDNTIGIPLGIPQVQVGAHYIGVFLKVDTGTFNIPIFNLQCMIDGRNLQGGLSSEPPHAEVIQLVKWADVKSGKTVNQVVTAGLQIPINTTVTQQVSQILNKLGTANTLVTANLYDLFEETDISITYAGTWTAPANALYSANGTAKKTTVLNSTAKFNFTGTSLEIMGYQDSTGSNNVSINIDGVSYAVSQYNASTICRIMQGVTGLVDKEHYCTVTNLQDTKGLVIDGICVDSYKILKVFNNTV